MPASIPLEIADNRNRRNIGIDNRVHMGRAHMRGDQGHSRYAQTSLIALSTAPASSSVITNGSSFIVAREALFREITGAMYPPRSPARLRSYEPRLSPGRWQP